MVATPVFGPELYVLHPDGRRQFKVRWRSPIEVWDFANSENIRRPGGWYDQFDEKIDFQPELWTEAD